MAKKTHSLKEFGAGYNSKIAPRDLKDNFLAKSQGVTSERPGTLSLLGKSNHLYEFGEEDYTYKDSLGKSLVTSSTNLGESITAVQDPGSGVFTFTSEYTFGYVGLINDITNDTGTPNPHIKITPDVSTPVKEGTGNAITDAIPIKVGDWIYIWGIKNTTGVHDLNDRHFKVTVINNDGTFELCNYFYGSNQILDMSKFSTLGGTYSQNSHGGYFKTIPEVNYTRYIVTQNGECLDLHYDVLNSKNTFSKGTIPVGTLGTLTNSDGRIGLLGNDANLDLGQSNNFEYWPQANGINYAIKPSFFFGDNILRYWSSNRVMRNSDGDTNKQSNPRWFGYIHKQDLFGIKASVTNINEWYLTDANIRPPARALNDTPTQYASYTNDELVDRASWDTGVIALNSNKLTANNTWEGSKRFSEDETATSGWHNMSGVARWQKGDLEDGNSDLSTLQLLSQKRGAHITDASGIKPILPLAMFNMLADGSMRISQKDYGSETGVGSENLLEYWHSPGASSDFNAANDFVSASGTNGWQWNRPSDEGALRGGSVTKSGTNQNPLYYSMGTYYTNAALSGVYILKFTLNDCSGTGDLEIALQGGSAVTVDTSPTTNYYNVTVQLTAGNEQSDEIDNWLIKFTPTHNDWSGTISNVKITKKYWGDAAVVCLINRDNKVEGEDAAGGWDKASYEFFQTFVYDTNGKEKQESCATHMKTESFNHYDRRTLRLSPAVNFSSDGFHYDMMDKRIIGSNIYFRKKQSDAEGSSDTNIRLLMEMDWIKGCRQWGGESGSWIPWTQNYLGDDESVYHLNYQTNSTDMPLDLSQIENSKVMPQYTDASKPFFEWEDVPVTTPTYQDNFNGHPHDEVGVGNARYGTMASVNGTKYIGNFSIPSSLTSGSNYRTNDFVPSYDYYPTSIARSSAGKDDMYCLSTDLLNLSGISESRIVKMYGLSKYLVVLCLDSYYILDMSQSIPLVYANNAGQGIKHECQSVKTDMGIMWVNDKGCFLFGQTEKGFNVQNLIEGKISKDKRGWVNNNEDSQRYAWDDPFFNIERPNRKGLYYWDITDEGEYVPSIGYDGENRKIIIKKSCKNVKNNDASHIYVYDFYTQGWTTNINGTNSDSQGLDENGEHIEYDSSAHYSFAPLEVGAYTSNFATLSNGEMIYHTNDVSTKIYKWHNSPLSEDSFNNISFNTKELIFEHPHNIKRIYQIYVTYRCTGDSGADMSYNLDGEEDSSHFETGRNNTNYNNSFNDTGGKWNVASLLFGSPINCYSIQLRLEGRAMPADFEINDITFVYKVKNVKVKV